MLSNLKLDNKVYSINNKCSVNLCNQLFSEFNLINSFAEINIKGEEKIK